VRIDPKQNRLLVGFKKDLETRLCRVERINWIPGQPDYPASVFTRVRYRHRAAASMLTPLDGDRVTVRFESVQSSITPGQGAVFYRGEEVLGGGWISVTP
jgi:tRNA-specific 2-thiouridylase